MPNPEDQSSHLTRLPEVGLGGRRKRRPERHDEILLVAVRLFEQLGYHGTSVEQIASEIDITPTTVYRHFVNKQAILDTAAVWISDQLLLRLNAPAATNDPRAQLHELVDRFIETVLGAPLFVSLLVRELPSLSPEARHYCLSRREEYLSHWCTAMSQVAPSLSDDEVKVTIHLVVSLITAAPSYHAPASVDLSAVLREMSLLALHNVRPATPRARARRA